jgi:hypothetical protein
MVALAVLLQLTSLSDLEQQFKNLEKNDWQVRMAQSWKINDGVRALVEQDKLQTGEFNRASDVIAVFNSDFRTTQMRYELCLSALCGGDKNAAKSIGAKWDEFLISMGRARRIGAVDYKGSSENYTALEPTAKSILAILKNPSAPATQTADNKEIKALVDADQADRQKDFSKVTTKEMMAMGARDTARLKRTRELVVKGDAHTAADFANAALVFQHGTVFRDYAMAHELCLCAMILGNANSSWLSGASYDRMLSHSGHAQRFATQYSIAPGGYALDWFDPDRINDTERKAVVHLTLEQAKNRKFN